MAGNRHRRPKPPSEGFLLPNWPLGPQKSFTGRMRGGDGRRGMGGAGTQWKKWRVPVKYSVNPAAAAAAMTSSSRIEPPGSTTA